MKYKATVYVMPLQELLDPQGKAVLESFQSQGQEGFQDVRIGKRIELALEAQDDADAHAQVKEACESMLYNPVMESYSYELNPQN